MSNLELHPRQSSQFGEIVVIFFVGFPGQVGVDRVGKPTTGRDTVTEDCYQLQKPLESYACQLGVSVTSGECVSGAPT